MEDIDTEGYFPRLPLNPDEYNPSDNTPTPVKTSIYAYFLELPATFWGTKMSVGGNFVKDWTRVGDGKK